MFKGRKQKSPYQWHLLLAAELVYVPAKDGQHLLLGFFWDRRMNVNSY